jgi:hypothetical protein
VGSIIGALVGGLLVAILLPPFPVARALSSDEGNLVSLVNAERAKRGLSTLAVASDLDAIARHHSEQMAHDGAIYHDTNLPNEVHGWQEIGENVGRGPSASAVHSAFMGSPPHRVHILKPQYTQIGVGAVWATTDGTRYLYVTEVFVERGSAPTVGHSVPHYAPKPKPHPKPAPPPPAPLPPPLPSVSIAMLVKLDQLDAGFVAVPAVPAEHHGPP